MHADGEIWSAALWNIYRAIGGDSLALADREAARDALLKSVILSHDLLPTSASMPDGAEAVMTTHAELDDYRGKYLMEMLNSFHDRGILKCDAAADLYMRDDPSDSGTEPSTGSTFWDSPDLWVRNVDDGITTFQEPEFGQDNYFYARVTNRGTATARAFVVTFNVKPWAGIEFIYPNDFVPFVSAAAGFNLAAGTSTIVKAKWPAAMIPSTGTHACLLAQVYMPTDTSPSGAHVWDKNNLAQKNMTIVDAIPGDTIWMWFQIGNLHRRIPDLYNIELVRPPRWSGTRVSLVGASPFETNKLFNSSLLPGKSEPTRRPSSIPSLKFREYASVELFSRQLSVPLRFNFAPGSSIDYADFTAMEVAPVEFVRNARLIELAHNKIEIELNEGRVAGLPVLIQPGTQLKCALKISIPEDARPGDSQKFHLVQRNTNGQIVGGIAVQVNIKTKKRITLKKA